MYVNILLRRCGQRLIRFSAEQKLRPLTQGFSEQIEACWVSVENPHQRPPKSSANYQAVIVNAAPILN